MENIINQHPTNRDNINALKRRIGEVVPFLGSGASVSYGYPLWKDLIIKLIEETELTSSEVKEIRELIKKKDYMNAVDKIDACLPNLSNYIHYLIKKIEKTAKHPTNKDDCGIWGKYLHLFEKKTYVTTNYDRVIYDVLKITLDTMPNIVTPATTFGGLRRPVIYYLHGIYEIQSGIVFTTDNYDDYYGMYKTSNFKLRRNLAKKLYELYTNNIFLFIGTSININQDRIFQLLIEINSKTPVDNVHYALLNIDEIKDVEKREIELLKLSIRPIWYSAKEKNHETAIEELCDYLFDEPKAELGEWVDTKGTTKDETNEKPLKTYTLEKKYYNTDKNYEFAIFERDGFGFLSDNKRTYDMLEKVFELKETDVIKNLDAILKECMVERVVKEFVVKINNWENLKNALQKELAQENCNDFSEGLEILKEKHLEIREAIYKLLSCVTFMDTMRIFYK